MTWFAICVLKILYCLSILGTINTPGQGTGISESSDSAASVAAANLVDGKWWKMVGKWWENVGRCGKWPYDPCDRYVALPV